MTVEEVFESASLSSSGPVRWRDPVEESHKGVYIVARVGNIKANCEACSLPINCELINGLEIDRSYEMQRWIPGEPVLYVGQTIQPLRKRIGQFYHHTCGNRSPHAGGQVILLVNCDLWLYWAPADVPKAAETTMLEAFRQQVGKLPFANFDGIRRPKRVRRAA